MSFTWDDGCDDVAKTVNSMVKFNSGAWKSYKQKQFVCSRLIPRADACFPRDAENSKMFGVTLNEGEFGLILGGYTRWADYGWKSVRRCGWFYVMNDTGILRKYKLRFRYEDTRGCGRVDETKTELEWKRPLGIRVSAPEVPPVEERSTLKFLGQEKERLSMSLTLKKVIDRGPGRFGHMFLSIWETEDGDIVYYNNILSGTDEGVSYNVTFTVKSHIVNKNNQNSTVVARMSATKEQNLINALRG